MTTSTTDGIPSFVDDAEVVSNTFFVLFRRLTGVVHRAPTLVENTQLLPPFTHVLVSLLRYKPDF